MLSSHVSRWSRLAHKSVKSLGSSNISEEGTNSVQIQRYNLHIKRRPLNRRFLANNPNFNQASGRKTATTTHIQAEKQPESTQESNRSTASGAKKFSWKEVTNDGVKTSGTFKVTSYNVLADSYSEPGPGRLAIQRPTVQGRVNLILRDLELLASDIFCLQEVESGLFESQFRPFFLGRGYDVEFCVKARATDPLTPEAWRPRIDGLVLAWRSAKFSKLSVTNFELRQLLFEHPKKWGVERKTMQSLLKLDTPVSIAMLETTHVRTAKKQLCIANIHGYSGGENAKPAINILQTQLALHGLRKVMYQHYGMNPKKVGLDAPAPVPLIFAGDFNARPGSGTYQLLDTGALEATSQWLSSGVNRQATAENLSHYLQLKSAYGASPFGEPRDTHHTSSTLHGCVDYVWYTPSSLNVHRILDLPDFTTRMDLKLPTVEFPSDHVPIGAEFSFSPTPAAPPPDKSAPVYVQSSYQPRDEREKAPSVFTKEKKPVVDIAGFDDEEDDIPAPSRSKKTPKKAKK